MKRTINAMITATALLGPINPGFAATSPSEDGSQLAVWLFLGMCALIVIVQLIPLAIMAVGFLKGLAKGKKEESPAPVEVSIDK